MGSTRQKCKKRSVHFVCSAVLKLNNNIVQQPWRDSTQIPLRGAGITFIVGTLFHIPDSRYPGYMNQQGWLPPCRPHGLRWQGLRIILFQLNYFIFIFPGPPHPYKHKIIHSEQTTQIKRKAPVSAPQGRAGRA